MRQFRQAARTLLAGLLLFAPALLIVEGQPPKKKTPIIVWLPPSPIHVGTPLSNKQLNASANAEGSFTYDPPVGSILPAGINMLSVDFSPADTEKYSGVNNTRTMLTVIPKLDPKITWKKPPDIQYGTPLGNDQLNATADTDGTFSYMPEAGTILHVGTDQQLAVTFTPTDTLIYNSASKVVTISVKPAMLTVTASSQSRSYGSANPTFALSFSGFANGEGPSDLDTAPVATSNAISTSPVGTYSIVPSGGKDTDYAFKYSNGTLTVTKAALKVAADNKSRLAGQSNPPLTLTYSGFIGSEGPSVLDTPPSASTTATPQSPPGVYPITASGGKDANYDFTYSPGKLTVIQASTPVLSDFQVVTEEDSVLTFTYRQFQQNAVGLPGDSIPALIIYRVPTNGTLTSAGKKINAGDSVDCKANKLVDFKFTPTPDFNGQDTLGWRVSGVNDPKVKATVAIFVAPVNDPPVIHLNGADSIPYVAGDPPVKLASKLTITDPDNETLISAQVVLSGDRTPGDHLSATVPTGSTLKVEFDDQEGILTVTGKDSKSAYEQTLQTMAFETPVRLGSSTSDKAVIITVNDGSLSSKGQRIAIAIRNYPELGIVNAFTPNSDGVNERWDFLNLGYYDNIQILIFDKNGNRVYDCSEKTCQWDGTMNGVLLPAGPYFYAIDLNKGTKTYHGTVTILR